ncbi:MAG: AI-2E family transporter [Patescibacteria group bacterium]
MNITGGTIAKVICGIFAFFAIVHLQSLIVSILVAVVVASFIEPLILFFTKRGLGRGVSVFITYALILAVVMSFIFLALPPLVRETFSAINSLPTTIKTADVLNPIQKSLYTVARNIFPDIPQRISIEDLVGLITSSFSNFVGGVFDTVSRFFGGVISFVIVIVLSVYLSIEHRGVARFLGLITPRQYEKYVIDLWTRVQIKIGRWIQGQFILMGIIFVLVFISLSICKLVLGDQIQHVFLLSLIAGVLEFIPVIGVIVSTIIAFLFTLLNGGVSVAVLVVIIFTLIHQTESHIFYPLVMKKITGVPPLLVIISLVAGIELAGFVGVLLSIPAAVLIVEYLDDHNRRKQMLENAARDEE